MSGERPTCQRCGRKLVPQRDTGVTPTGVARKLLGYGYNATGLFCSLTCGHWFAVDLLRGKRELQLVIPATVKT